MKEDLSKFKNLLLTDEDFREKLKKAAQAYSSEMGEEDNK